MYVRTSKATNILEGEGNFAEVIMFFWNTSEILSKNT